MKLLTIFPIFTQVHAKELSSRVDHVLVCDRRSPFDPGNGGKTKVIPIRLVFFGLTVLIKLFRKQMSVPAYMVGLDAVLKSETPDVIVVTDFFQLYFWQCVAFVRKNPATRLYLYSESKMLPQSTFSKLLMRYFLARLKRNGSHISGILTFSNYGKQFFETLDLGMPVHVLANPIDVHTYHPPIHREFLKGGVLHIVMVARYVEYKRHQDLFDALAILHKNGKLFHLTCVGSSGYQEKELSLYASTIGIADSVEFLKPMRSEEMVDLYSSNDVLVLPSFNEAIGLVVPEAMACGTPTITSDTVGANVYVQDGVTGYVFKTYDVKDLVSVLEKVYDKENLSIMGVKARIRALEFSVEEQVTKLLQIIL